MQTAIPEPFRSTPQGQEAERILRTCVHCGFCTATCPTYQLLGDELDGPRGRIYLIKSVAEGREVSGATQRHLDRCLTCRACETTCPSGVEYGRLVDIGRELTEQRVERPLAQRIARRALRWLLPHRERFTLALRLAQMVRVVLPRSLGIVPRTAPPAWPASDHARRMLVLDGCVQPSLAPNTNAAAAQVLDRLGITLLHDTGSGCCGAVSQHLSAPAEARDMIRRNIDAWWPHVEQGIEAVVSTASGCGVTLREYGYLLRDDPDYADRAQRISALVRDLSEVLGAEDLSRLGRPGRGRRVSFHAPCTLQHGMKINGRVEAILQGCGYSLCAVEDGHLCCGSAGTYSILQSDIAGKLREQKIRHLQAGRPDVIATANIGCQAWLASKSAAPVRHWIELLV